MRIQNVNGEITLISKELDVKWATDRTLYVKNRLKGDTQFRRVKTGYPEGKMPYNYHADEKAVWLANYRKKVLQEMRRRGEI